ncbi:hypothetical protein SALBM135S_01781 [Streptomyces alboniger]
MLGQPGQAVRRVGQFDHAEPQAFPLQGAAQHQGLARAGAELLGHVGRHPRVRRRGGGEHRDALRQLGEHRAQPAVVGAEVVAPVGDAVRLVHHEETGRGRELGQHLLAEVHGVEPLGADQEDVGLAALDLFVDRPPLLRVGGVDGAGLDPGPRRRFDLVAHEREQRRDDHRGPRAAAAQQGRRDEVHRRLAPAGALHHQTRSALPHQGGHGLPLVLALCRAARIADEFGEDCIGFGAELQIVHAPMQPDTTDNRPLRRRCTQPRQASRAVEGGRIKTTRRPIPACGPDCSLPPTRAAGRIGIAPRAVRDPPRPCRGAPPQSHPALRCGRSRREDRDLRIRSVRGDTQGRGDTRDRGDRRDG